MERWSSTRTGWRWKIWRAAWVADRSSFTGYITYGNNIGFDLTSHGTDIRFRYAGVSVTADQDLRLAGTLKSSSLSRRNYGDPFRPDSVGRTGFGAASGTDGSAQSGVAAQ